MNPKITKLLRGTIAHLRPVGFALIRFWLRASCPNLTIRKGAEISFGAHIRATDGGTIVIGSECSISRGVTLIAQGGSIRLGDHVFIGPWTTITSKMSVSIGDDCLVAERVSIRDQDHTVHESLEVPIRAGGFSVAAIEIQRNVWIAAGAVILRGVRIGEGSVVGANAVVIKNVGETEIVAGVPACRVGLRRHS